MHLFFCPDLETGLVTLPEEEAHHAVHVLRLAVGKRIGLLNGRGTRAEAELVDVNKRTCTAMVLESQHLPPERAGRVHLAVAPTKNLERYEWLVEKAVEIGVDRIIPLQTARTERFRLRIDRLERVAISAMKQSQRAWLPQIDVLMPLKDLLAEQLPQQRFFGWCESGTLPFVDLYDPGKDTLMVIGPEGDFTPAEAEEMRAHGLVPVSLGAARLRTETAAIVACSWIGLNQSGNFGAP